MTVLKQYNPATSEWETIVVGKQGPQGPIGEPGVEISGTPPTDTSLLWIDSDDVGDMVVPAGGATGQVLAKASGTNYDTAWGAPLDVYAGRMVSGEYYTGWRLVSINLTQSEAQETGMVFIPQVSVTLTRIGILVTGAGTSGAVIRLGIREMNLSTWLPGDVLADGGTVNAETTGFKTVTISLAVTAGVPYYLTATNQGTPATRAQVNCSNGTLPIMGSTTAGALRQSFEKSGVSGALNNTGTFSRSANAFPNVYVGVI